MKHESILFTNEKNVTVEEVFNKKNDKIFAQTSKNEKTCIPWVQRGHHPSAGWESLAKALHLLHLCGKGFKTESKVYQQDVLEGVVKQLSNTLFDGEHYEYFVYRSFIIYFIKYN